MPHFQVCEKYYTLSNNFKKMRNIFTLCLVVSIAGILVYLVQKTDTFSLVKSSVQTQQVPGKILNEGTLGKVLRSGDFIKPVSKGEDTYRLSSPKRKIKTNYYFQVNSKSEIGL